MSALLADITTTSVAPPKAFVAFPELTRDEVFMIGTRRLWLRWPRFDDAEALARIGGDPRVALNIATWPVGTTAALAHERIGLTRAENAAGTRFAFSIVRRETWNEPIGLIGFTSACSDDGLAATGGYHLDPDYWGQGYATEALTGIISMIRLLTRIRVLNARVMPHNTASARVLKKSGFAKIGASTLTTPFSGAVPVIDYQRRLNVAPPLKPT
jgi:RimJ/RimL family protein N-acetyltransferase